MIHKLDDILQARVLAIACGYEDADDLDALRDDPGFRLALGKLPGSGAGLASQPTMSRWENAPTTREPETGALRWRAARSSQKVCGLPGGPHP